MEAVVAAAAAAGGRDRAQEAGEGAGEGEEEGGGAGACSAPLGRERVEAEGVGGEEGAGIEAIYQRYQSRVRGRLLFFEGLRGVERQGKVHAMMGGGDVEGGLSEWFTSLALARSCLSLRSFVRCVWCWCFDMVVCEGVFYVCSLWMPGGRNLYKRGFHSQEGGYVSGANMVSLRVDSVHGPFSLALLTTRRLLAPVRRKKS